MRTIKLPDGTIREDRRAYSSNGTIFKGLLSLIFIMLGAIGFLIPKWIDPIQTRVLALEQTQETFAKEVIDKRVQVSERLVKVEENLNYIVSQVEKMDKKIDKLLDTKRHESAIPELPRFPKPATSEQDGSI